MLVEEVEAAFPEPAVVLQPVGGALQRSALESRGAQLRGAPARDQPGALQHLEVLGDRLEADRERLGQLVDRGLALREPREDRAARGIGESREGVAELVDGHDVFTCLVAKPIG